MSVGAVETVKKPDDVVQASTDKETKDFYAWANIDFGADVVEGGFISGRKTVKYGDKVVQKDIGIDDDEWKKLTDERVIRKSVPPQVGQFQSPKRALIARAKAAMEAALLGGD